MNGFRKNKGIVLELTSLLDVIMIMLFWVMTDVSASADSQKEDAKAQVQAVTQQLEEQKQKSADELEKLRKDMQKQIDEAYKKAESINSNAAKNQQPTTATSTELKSSCNKLLAANGRANSKIFLNNGPFSISISLLWARFLVTLLSIFYLLQNARQIYGKIG